MFEWDPNKRESNFLRHGLDFGLCDELFDGRPMLTRSSPQQGEKRKLSICAWEGRIVTVIWTRRGENRRIISLRSERHGERREYRSLYGGGDEG
jgi:uncharacterized DUF497 family protein